jgi:hypothetical protein
MPCCWLLHVRIRAICSGLIGFSGSSLSPSVSDSSSMPYFSRRESFCACSAAAAADVGLDSLIGKQQQKNLMRVFALPRHSPVLRACLKDGRTRPPVNEGMAFSNDRADDASRWLAACVALKIEASHL